MSARYLGDLKYRLARFAEDFNGQPVATISSAQIDDWLRSLGVGPVTRNNFRRILIVAFNYARERGYCLANPAGTTAKAKAPDKPAGILTVNETARLMEAAVEVAGGELVPYFAIGCFAGLRPAELARLDWSDLHFDDGLIEVTAKTSKTARRRFVKIQPNLGAWLAPFRRHKGKVAPVNLRKKDEAARKAAKLFGDSWPSDAARHSFASYHLAQFGDAAALALEMGHTDSGMIFEHYRQLVKPKEAARYWKIAPNDAAGAEVVPFAPAQAS